MSSRKSGRRAPLPAAPDGGWGWLMVAAAFLMLGLSDGIFTCMGLLTLAWIDDFERSMADVAWISSIFGGFMLSAAPIGSALANRFGFRSVMILGGLLGSVALAVSSLAPSVEWLIVTIGLLTGLGLGLVYTPCIAAVGLYFESKRAMATGVAICGSGVGMFVFPPLTSLLLGAYGWRGTCLVLAAVYLNCIALAGLFRPVAVAAAPVSRATSDDELQSQPLQSEGFRNEESEVKMSTMERLFRFSLFRSLAFVLINFSTLISSLGYMIPFTFLAPHAEMLGVSRDAAAFLLSIIGITTCAGPIVGWIIDRPGVSALWVSNVAITLCGIATIIMPFFQSYGMLVVYAATFGLSISTMMPTRTTLLTDIVGVNDMANAFGYQMFFFGLTIFFGNPLAGFFYDLTGDFNNSFHFAGVIILASAVLLYPLNCIDRWQKRRTKKTTGRV